MGIRDKKVLKGQKLSGMSYVLSKRQKTTECVERTAPRPMHLRVKASKATGQQVRLPRLAQRIVINYLIQQP